MAEGKWKLVGVVAHYYTRIGVAVIELSDSLELGDEIRIMGATTNFEQKVESMQIEHKNVEKAGGGDSVGLKVVNRCRKGDRVYKLLNPSSPSSSH